MTEKQPDDDYAIEIIRALGRGEADAPARAERFLKRRLTQAAIHGCHHCDEYPKGSPCGWCGLKGTGR